ncbi:hypothetical protein GCM10009727_55410 [Actinomadura napierensis]|uniref:Uncharacterized protein n=2 Tax=Actinomadura napierensis TaxID=267854 RepID=A0ABN2ZZE4_9ACTN
MDSGGAGTYFPVMAVSPQRVAFDAARVLVSAAGSDLCWWLCGEVGRCLGTAYEARLLETRLRLQEDDVYYKEAGCWRALLDDVLMDRPDAAECLYRVVGPLLGASAGG